MKKNHAKKQLSQLLPLKTLQLILAASFLTLTGIFMASVLLFQAAQRTYEANLEIQAHRGNIQYLDEVLTMSARMAATLENSTEWIDRYNVHAQRIDEEFASLEAVAPEELYATTEQTSATNDRLIDLERTAFMLIEEKYKPEAIDLLTGDEYRAYKKVLWEGIKNLDVLLAKRIQKQRDELWDEVVKYIVAASSALVILMVLWFWMVKAMGRSQKELKESIEERDVALLRQAAAAMEAEQKEAQYRAVVDNAADGIVTINSYGLIQNMNPTAEEILGYTRDEIIGKNVKMFVPSPYHEDHDSYLERARSRGKLLVSSTSPRELEAVKKNGKVFPIELSLSQVRHATGELVYVGIMRDISDRKMAERELIQHRDHLQEMVAEQTESLKIAKDVAEKESRSKSEFLANMSHELRTPMHAILSYSSLGIDKIDSGDTAKILKYLTNINNSGKRLLVLLNDILDLSKLVSGKMVFDLSPTNVVQLIENCMNEFDAMAKENCVTLALEMPQEDVKAACDEARITQVVGNLLSNAIKFSPDNGTVHISVKPSHMRMGGEGEGGLDADMMTLNAEEGKPLKSGVEICVRDEGIGIPPDEVESIFDQFFQSSKTKTGAGGTGLGLPICREIIDGHGGYIWAQNNKNGVGAAFTFMLPIEARTSAHEDETAARESGRTESESDAELEGRLRELESKVTSNRSLKEDVESLNEETDQSTPVTDQAETREGQNQSPH